MDEIQSYSPHSAVPSPARVAAAPLAINPAAVKTPSNYLKALRRRVWVVLAIAVPLSIVACIYVLRMPPVYLVKAEIEINAPDYDPALADAGLARHRPARCRQPGTIHPEPRRPAQEQPAPRARRQRGTPTFNRNSASMTIRRRSSSAASRSFRRARRTATPSSSPSRGTTARGPRSSSSGCSTISSSRRRRRTGTRSSRPRPMPLHNLKNLEMELKNLDDAILNALKANSTIGPGGKSIIEEQYVNLGALMAQKQTAARRPRPADDARRDVPQGRSGGEAPARMALISQLEIEKRKDLRMLKDIQQGRPAISTATPRRDTWPACSTR